MIGVISKNFQKPFVEEFFQLFKAPWEFYDKEKTYDVIIVTDNTFVAPSAKLLIIFGPGKTPFDKNRMNNYLHPDGVTLEHNNLQFPVYTDLVTFHSDSSIIKITDGKESAGFISPNQNQWILRIGYDLFDEIAYLLSRGQPVEYAHIPTLEIHISMLRKWILESGLPLVEIPPIPGDYNFITCLTHDVDFLGIRNHKFDHSVIGFILRVLFLSYFRDVNSKISWARFLRNWKALLSIPGVYFGLFRDFWFDIDRYMEIEKGMCSTFFFIPFKDHPGDTDMTNNHPPKRRAARYDINDYKVHIEALKQKGHEIGLHGLDAWHNSAKGLQELHAVRQIAGEDDVGVRMHWLYFSEHSPKTLGEAGFLYDSTLGYNEAIGFRSGTTQVFRLGEASHVLELPLHVMDTSLFSQGRMGMSEANAFDLCKRLINNMRDYGGVFTINWHTRSLSPERNWDEFYIELLNILKTEKVWFATAKQTINWFNKRRSINFDAVKFIQNKVEVKLGSNPPFNSPLSKGGISEGNNSPACLLRVHIPDSNASLNKNHHNSKQTYIDIPLSGESAIEVAL